MTKQHFGKKKKLLYFVQLPPPIHGASLINQQVVSSKVINQLFHTTIIELQLSKKLSSLGKLSFHKIGKFLLTCGLLVKTITQKDIEFVYMTINPTGGALYRDVVYVLLLKLFRKKIIYHLHGRGILENSYRWHIKEIYHFIFQNTHIITPSRSLSKSEFTHLHLKNTYLHIVENGIPKIDIPDKNKNSSTLKCLFLGTLMESKGIYILIDAFDLAQKVQPSIHLNLVGSPINDNELSKIKNYIIQKKLSEKITLYPANYSNEKYHHFVNADIFVYPTLNDCFPLVLLEAMQAGIPIIASDVGGIADIIENGKTGLIIKKQDTQAVFESIISLCSNKQRRDEMGNAARNKFLNQYTLTAFEEKMRLTFDEIMQ